ncbi:4-oxalocrotonate tautomerase [Bradyrhizobium liaoningense]
MPEITISMAEGRTDEQKAGMMRDITQALVKNLGVDADAVVIQINEAPLRHKMKGGKTFVERAQQRRRNRPRCSADHNCRPREGGDP